jgi:hypothetical protein
MRSAMKHLGSHPIPATSQDKFLLPGELMLPGSAWHPQKLDVFLDSGANRFALIDKSFARSLNLPLERLLVPQALYLADKTLARAGPVLFRTTPTFLCIGGHQEQLSFLVAPLSHKVVLGLPWLQHHNPFIDWRTMGLAFCDPLCSHAEGCSLAPTLAPICLTECHSRSTLIFPFEVPNDSGTLTFAQTVEGQPCLADLLPLSNLDHIVPLEESPTVQAACEVELLNADDFLDVLLETHPEVFAILVSPSVPNQADENSITIAQVVSKKIYAQSQTPLSVTGMPLKYNEYADIFSSKTDSPPGLPPHRRYDLKIELQEDANLPPPSKIYSLSPAESSALEAYIEKALARGWISPSESPLGATCFYVPQPNGGLWFCIDYHRLNEITKKNAYPLPLISDLIDRISEACIYSRLNLPDTYHLVRVRKGDEWKTAFRCKFGSFQYNDVSFGLSNAPAAFQGRYLQRYA